MPRPTVAILDDQLPAKIEAEPHELDGIDIVWTGTSLDAMHASIERLGAKILVLQLDHLGRDPIATARELAGLAKAELVLVTYAFARRELLDELQRQQVRLLRRPMTLAALRAQMTSAIVRSLMAPSVSEDTKPHPIRDDSILRPPRFSPSQLAKLESSPSSVQCECPQHVSSLLSSLVYFEAYCKDCESRNDEDAKVHRLLYERTARARMLLEDALERVLEHEDLRV